MEAGTASMTPERDKIPDGSARLISDIPAAVALFDRELRYIAASAAWIDVFGLGEAPLVGYRHDEICAAGRAAIEHVQRHALAGEALDDCPATGTDALPGLRHATLAARPHRDADGGIAGIVVALRTEERSDPAKGSVRAADPLTGLAERPEFAHRLQAALHDPDPARRALLVLAVNLDNLRNINNLYGFATGDQVVKIVTERLLAGTRSRLTDDETGGASRQPDMVARLGPGEFGIICAPPAPSLDHSESLAARLLRLVQGPIALGERSLLVAANVGFVGTTAAHRTPDDVLRDLDLALQQARALGPGKVTAWEPSLTRTATRGYTLAEELRRAFANGEFVLHYQPVLRLDDNRMVGAEALLRWNHPREGLAPSASFVPVLEQTGLIVEVGCWVVREAVRQVENWRTLYGRNIVEWVGVNLAARQLDDPAALLATLRGIHAGGFSVHRLKLEVAERVLLRRLDAAATALAELHGLGIGLAIDDFGTGGLPLDSLRRYPIDTIKIDGALVARSSTADGKKLLQALLDAAGAAGAAVIAKGIETAAQRDFMRQAGCGLGQGYLLAEPMAGALLGAFALTHAVTAERPRPAAGEPDASPSAALSRTSANPSRGGSGGAARSGRPAPPAGSSRR
jgi:diguanylate cyclase (GGDEF)-like protein